MTPSAIRIESLDVERGGRPVLRSVSLAVEAGELTGLLGPSGCGKTTLMRSIVGVQQIAGGSVTVLGADAGTPPLRRRVAYMTQASSVYADLSVRENLAYFARVLGVARGRIDEVIATVDLERLAGSIVRNLSGGERARVSLATALLGEPEVLVLDEPTVGLDPLLRVSLWNTFRSLADAGTALLISSHVMDEAEHCDRLVLMHDGRVIESTTPDALRASTGEQRLEDAFVALLREERAR